MDHANINRTGAATHRPRRLRQQPQLRAMLAEQQLRRSDVIVPVFVAEGNAPDREVASMPGVFQRSVQSAVDWLSARADAGFGAALLFGVIEPGHKDERGSPALDPDNVVCRLLRACRERTLPMALITDLCLCEYTSHGHCGPVDAGGHVSNDATLPLLVEQALNHARAGADVIAPSGMMDGTIAALRAGLDDAGFVDTALMAYAVKYASAFYGPFRDAAGSAPGFGDRRGYQMDPSRGRREARLEARLDVEQGADFVMVKPAGPYLDVIADLRGRLDVPLVAYQVSGEYAMIEAAARNGWLDRDRVVLESLNAIRRAGADLIISYFAEVVERLLPA